MNRVLLVAIALCACAKVVKQEGFRAMVQGADEPALEGAFEAVGEPSCGRFLADRREVHLVADRFKLDVVDEPFSGVDRSVSLVVDGERFVADRAGADSSLAIDNPGGRIIGSLRATLIHESAGTTVDGRPAPIRQLGVDLTFNLQPCL